MPWPMVHFSLAERVRKRELTPEFLLGSVAPDAIHMREGSTREDKGRTHLLFEDGTMPDLAVIHRFCEERLTAHDPRYRQFIMGYAAHILTDLRWTETVWRPYVEQAGQQGIEQFAHLKSIYNQEVCQLEYDLLRRENLGDHMLTAVSQSQAYPLQPMLTESEIAAYGVRVVNHLRDWSMEPRIVPVYIMVDIVKDFIVRTAEELQELVGVWERVNS